MISDQKQSKNRSCSFFFMKKYIAGYEERIGGGGLAAIVTNKDMDFSYAFPSFEVSV